MGSPLRHGHAAQKLENVKICQRQALRPSTDGVHSTSSGEIGKFYISLDTLTANDVSTVSSNSGGIPRRVSFDPPEGVPLPAVPPMDNTTDIVLRPVPTLENSMIREIPKKRNTQNTDGEKREDTSKKENNTYSDIPEEYKNFNKLKKENYHRSHEEYNYYEYNKIQQYNQWDNDWLQDDNFQQYEEQQPSPLKPY